MKRMTKSISCVSYSRVFKKNRNYVIFCTAFIMQISGDNHILQMPINWPLWVIFSQSKDTSGEIFLSQSRRFSYWDHIKKFMMRKIVLREWKEKNPSAKGDRKSHLQKIALQRSFFSGRFCFKNKLLIFGMSFFAEWALSIQRPSSTMKITRMMT